MKKRLGVIMILTTLAITLAWVIPNSNYMIEFWTKLNTYETQANVIKQDRLPWKLETVRIGKDENIYRHYFFDGNIIYGISYENFVTTFYKTSDGGKSWERQSSFSNFGIDDIFFVTPTEGLITLSKITTASTPNEDISYLMKTEDGGLSWKTIHSSADSTFDKLLFNSDGLGIVIGSRKIPDRTWAHAGVVLLTNDFGQTWNDISETINGNLNPSIGQFADSLTHLTFSKDKGIVALSLRGKILNSMDLGKSWSLISKIVDEPEQTGFSEFGELEGGKFWVAGGTMSIEGKWGVIAVMTKKFGWDKYRLNGYYFSDVKSLSNSELMATAVGLEPNGAKKGVILYSSNLGKDWSVIGHLDTPKLFTSIFTFSGRKVLAVANDGTGILFER